VEISIVDKEDFLDLSGKEELIFIVKKILKYLNLSTQSELCISFVSDTYMRELNLRYRDIDATTDVLCFPQQSETAPNLLGDIVISYQTAVRHSRKFDITLNEELHLLIVHAVLHLFGFDHKKRKEREVMREKEKEILNYLIQER